MMFCSLVVQSQVLVSNNARYYAVNERLNDTMGKAVCILQSLLRWQVKDTTARVYPGVHVTPLDA